MPLQTFVDYAVPVQGFLVDGTLVSDKPQKLQRWKEYYSELLNRPSAPPSCELQEAAAQANPDVTIDSAPPSSAEVQRAIHPAAHHVCTLAACFSQSSEDVPLQTLLSVIPSSVFVVPVK